MSLFVKYEVKEINDILGNEENKIMINGFLNKKDKPQCFLFYGERGCGKTLTANLIALKLDCKFNIYELNASNDRGIDAIRKVIESCQFKSLNNKPKAYIIDEAHQLPTLSQEALLTTLQNPPKDTYFFFCTTEKNKILPTVQSRCIKLNFETINTRDLYPYLIEISKKEKNEISKNIARRICETAEGHVRDAINILEKVLEFRDEEKQYKVAGEKIEEQKQVIDLCRALLKERFFSDNIKGILKSIEKENPESIRKIIINYMNKVLLDNGNERAAIVIEHLDTIIYDFPVLCMLIFKILL